MARIALLLAVLLLTACGTPATTTTAQSVLDAFLEAGLAVENVRAGERVADTPLPNSYQEHMVFDIPELGEDRGGQVFVCDTKQNCDALYAYFDALKGLAGPYLYQSADGRVVVQLNNGLTPEQAAPYRAAIEALP